MSGRLVVTIACLMAAALPGGRALAQSATAQAPPAAAQLPTTPTTRILAIGRLTAAPDPTAMRSVMPGEVRSTVELYLSGKIAGWWVRKDQPGVVFLLDVRDVGEARTLLEALPLDRAGLMTFDLIPLGPLSPLGLLTK